MAKKKALFGVNNYHKRTPKKRPGVHTKTKENPIEKSTKARGVSETHNDHINVFNFWWRHQVGYV